MHVCLSHKTQSHQEDKTSQELSILIFNISLKGLRGICSSHNLISHWQDWMEVIESILILKYFKIGQQALHP